MAVKKGMSRAKEVLRRKRRPVSRFVNHILSRIGIFVKKKRFIIEETTRDETHGIPTSED